jgi:serine/threonine-protein kinase RsbW
LAAADDAVLCLSELVSNAVLHGRSHRPGGRFTVRACLDAARLRVEVSDEGGPWEQHEGGDAQRGRGLAIVAHLAPRWGLDGTEDGRTAWFEMTVAGAASAGDG